MRIKSMLPTKVCNKFVIYSKIVVKFHRNNSFVDNFAKCGKDRAKLVDNFEKSAIYPRKAWKTLWKLWTVLRIKPKPSIA